MQAIILLTFGCVTLADFLTLTLNVPGVLKFTPELLSGIVTIYVLVAGMRQRFRLVSAKYFLLFGALAFVIVCGILTNGVGSGPMLSGIRYYLRAIPFFLLPAVYEFTEPQIEQQLTVLKWLALLQLPLASYQRWVVWYQERFSGDSVSGTLMNSGVMSLFEICTVLVIVGLFLRNRVGKFGLVALFFLLLFPTTINETKVTVLALPLGLVVTLAIGAPAGQRLRVIGWAMALLVTFAAIFIPVYDFTQENNPYKKEIVDFFTDDKQLTNYVEAKKGDLGTTQQVGRVDAISVPLHYLARDPLHLAFGLGIGNASHSLLGENFVGTYYDIFQHFVITSFTVFILEIGVFGTIMVFVLYWLIFWDTVAVVRADSGLIGAIAVGWTGTVAIMTAATIYNPIHIFASVSYLYWYFSGLVAARRVQIAMTKSDPIVADDPTEKPSGKRNGRAPQGRLPNAARVSR